MDFFRDVVPEWLPRLQDRASIQVLSVLSRCSMIRERKQVGWKSSRGEEIIEKEQSGEG